ncbi:hypothetical protein AX768_05515 [Burkholderia sp. PAMC 28687]|nr:hypothetical protein AX768_05515 [Burkholderia sp. PAMC 28687]
MVAVVQALRTADAQPRENARRDKPDRRGKGGSGGESGDFKEFSCCAANEAYLSGSSGRRASGRRTWPFGYAVL